MSQDEFAAMLKQAVIDHVRVSLDTRGSCDGGGYVVVNLMFDEDVISSDTFDLPSSNL